MTVANVKIAQVLLKRGNTARSLTYTGPIGEVTIDTDLNTLRIHDGITAGGHVVQGGSGGNVDLTGYASIPQLTANINTVNSKITGSNAAIVTANTALKSYVDAQVATKTTTTYVDSAISTAVNNLINSAPGTLDTLNEIAANLASEASAIGAITNSITATNANVTAANVQIASLWANAGAQANSLAGANLAIVAANTAMRGYVDAVTTAWTANAATQQGLITTLQSNAGVQADAIATLQANAATQQTAINTLQANVGGFYTWANTNFGTSSYANANVASYLPAYSGNLSAGNVTFGTYAPGNYGIRTTGSSVAVGMFNTSSLTVDSSGNLLLGGTGHVRITGASGSTVTIGGGSSGNVYVPAGIVFNDGTKQTTAYTGYDDTEVAAYLSGNVTTGNLTVNNNAVVLGNLRVLGTQTAVNTATLSVNDLFITVANGAAQASDANGAGIRVAGALANIAYSSASDSFEFNKAITVGNVIFSNNTRLYNNNVTLPNGQGFNWHFNDPSIGSSTTTLYYNGLTTGFDSWSLETGNGTNAWILDSDTQEFYLFNGSGSDGKLVFGTASNASTGSINDIELKSTVGNVYITANAHPWTFREDGNLILPTNMNFMACPAVSGTGIIFGDGTYQYEAWTGIAPIATRLSSLDGELYFGIDNESGNIRLPGNVNIAGSRLDLANDSGVTLSNAAIVQSAVSTLDAALADWTYHVGYDIDPVGGPNRRTLYNTPIGDGVYFSDIDFADGSLANAWLNWLSDAWAVQNANTSPLWIQPAIPSAMRSQLRTLFLTVDTAYNALIDAEKSVDLFAGNATYTFGSDGNLTLPGHQSPLVPGGYIFNVKGIVGLTASSGATISGFNTVSAQNFTFANGVNILSTVSGGGPSLGNLTIYDSTIQSETSGAFINMDVDGDYWMRLGTYENKKLQLITDWTGNTNIWEFGIDGNLTVPGDILPTTDNTQDLGSATNRFRHLYVGPGTVYVGNAAIKTTATGNLILPGLTRAVASSAYAEEVEDTGDQTQSFTTIPTVIDNARYERLSGGQVSNFGPALYEVDQLDGEGFIDGITITNPGTGYADDVAALAEQSMWATEEPNPLNNFNSGDWVRIPFRVRSRAGESEFEFSAGGSGSSSLEGLEDVQLDGPSEGQVLTWNNSQEKWENRDAASGSGLGSVLTLKNSDYALDFGTSDSSGLGGANNNDYQGERIVLWNNGGAYDGEWHYAMGMEDNHMWFGIDAYNESAWGYKWYGQNHQILKLDSAGTITLGSTSSGIFWSNGDPYSTGGTSNTMPVIVGDTAEGQEGALWYNTIDGRLYVSANVNSTTTWIDASPSTIPAPSTYLGDLEIDGNVISFPAGTLTIDSTGNLLVNGNLVTGSGGNGTVDLSNIQGSVIVNHENSGFVVDAGNDRRVGFMKYQGFEGSFIHADGPTKAIPFRIGRVTADDITQANVDVFTTEVYVGTNGHVRIGDDSSNTINDPAYRLQVVGNVYASSDIITAGKLSVTNANPSDVTAILTRGLDANFQLTAQNGTGNNTGNEVARFGLNYNGEGWNTFTQYVRGGSAQDGHQVLWAGNVAMLQVSSDSIEVAGDIRGNIVLPVGGTIKNHDGSTYGGSGAGTAQTTFTDNYISNDSENPVVIRVGTYDYSFEDAGVFGLPYDGVIKPYGGSSTQVLKLLPTGGESGDHIHLVSGDMGATSIFLGTDQQYVRTRTDGAMIIGTSDYIPDEDGYGNRWIFSNIGETVFPDHGAVTMTGNLTVGNLVVTGNSTIINTVSYSVEDNVIQIASGNPADTLDIGFVGHRTVGSTLEHTGLVRNASIGKWILFSNVVSQPGATVDFTSAIPDDLITGRIQATDFTFANGATIASTLSLSSNVAATAHLSILAGAPTNAGGSAGDYMKELRIDDNYLYVSNGNYGGTTYTSGGTNVGITYTNLYGTGQNGFKYASVPSGEWTNIRNATSWTHNDGNGAHSMTYVSDDGAGLFSFNVGSYQGIQGSSSLTYTVAGDNIWKTVPLNTFRSPAFGNANVAAYLTSNPQAGTYSNANVASYLVANPQAGTYSNANVASYLVASAQTIGNATITGTTTFGTAMQIVGSTNTITSTNGSAIQFGQGVNFNSATRVAVNGNILAQSGASSTSTGTGAIQVTGGVGVSGNVFAGAVYSNNFNFANGVNILSTVSGSYGNTQVAAYLPTYTGNIGAANIVTTGATSGNISGANYISANVFQVSTGIFWANGTAWSSTSGGGTNYTNANVSSFLASFGSNVISTTGNITAGNLIGTQYGNTFGTTAIYSGNVTAANIIANQFGNSVGTTATYSGNITAANIVTTGTYGNITGANVISANTVTVTTVVRTVPVTFANLPSASAAGAGARAFITDGNTSTFASAVTGSGANSIPVYSNGTNWFVG